MSKLYQPTKNNPYRLRDSVYYWTVSDIRDAGKYLQGYYDDYLAGYAPSVETVEAVTTALQDIPEEYREIVFNNIAYETALPAEYRNKVTTLTKAKYIYKVAELTGRPLGAKEIVYVEYDWR